MVTRLLQAGYPLVAWNRSRIADPPAEAVRYAECHYDAGSRADRRRSRSNGIGIAWVAATAGGVRLAGRGIGHAMLSNYLVGFPECELICCVARIGANEFRQTGGMRRGPVAEGGVL